MLGQGHPSVEEETQRHWPILKSCFLPDSPLFSRMGSWYLSPIWNLFKYLHPIYYWLHSVQFSHSVVSDSLRPHESQHTRPPCPSPIPGVHANSCALSQWCHLAISSSVVPFSSCLQSFLAPGSFAMSQLFTLDGWSIGVSASASILPMNIQDWFPLGWTDWISLQSKGLSRVFSSITIQKNQLFGTQNL